MPYTRAAPSRSTRARQVWRQFEQWLSSPRATMEHERTQMLTQMDLGWRKLPLQSRPKKHEHEAAKLAACRRLEKDFYVAAREEWVRRLEEVGLVPEDWDDITAQETAAVEKALGTDAYDDDVVEDTSKAVQLFSPPSQPPATLDHAAPALTVATRSANSSGTYEFVNPKDFGRDDDPSAEDDFPFVIPGMETIASTSRPVSTSSGLSTALRWGSQINPQLAARRPDIPTLASLPPLATEPIDQRTPKTYTFDHAPPAVDFPLLAQPSRSPPKRPPDVHTHRLPSDRGSPIAHPACVGPVLIDPEETLDEDGDDEDFEQFKLETRKTKIVEFHRAAAEAGVVLVTALHHARRSKNSFREQAALAVRQHEKRLWELREEKEKERRDLVDQERERRREQARQRSMTIDGLPSSFSEAWAFDTTRPPSGGDQDQDALEEQIADDLAREMSFALHGSSSAWDRDSELGSFYAQLEKRERRPSPQMQSHSYTLPAAAAPPHPEEPAQAGAFDSMFGGLKQIRSLFGSGGHAPEPSPPSHVYGASMPTAGTIRAKPASAATATANTNTTKTLPGFGFGGPGSQSAIDGLPPPLLASASAFAAMFTVSSGEGTTAPATATDTMWRQPQPPVHRHHHRLEAEGVQTPVAALQVAAKTSPVDAPATEKAPSSKKQRSKARKGQPPAAAAAFEEAHRALDAHPPLSATKLSTTLPPVSEPQFDEFGQAPPAFADHRVGSIHQQLHHQHQHHQQHSGAQPAKLMTKAETMKAGLSKIQTLDPPPAVSLSLSTSTPRPSLQAPPAGVQNSPIAIAPATKAGWRTVGHAAASKPPASQPQPPVGANANVWAQRQVSPIEGGDSSSPWATVPPPPPLAKTISLPSQSQPSAPPQFWNASRARTSSSPEYGMGMGMGVAATQPQSQSRRALPQSQARSHLGPSVSSSTSAWSSSSSSSSSLSSSSSNMKKARTKTAGKAKAAAVTIEEVSDEEGPNGARYEEPLPSNSRVILEPRPSKPPAAFSSIYSYSEDDEDDEDTGLSSFAATPSTAPTSPDGLAPWSDEWIAATLSAGNVEWSKKFGVGAEPLVKGAKVSPNRPPPVQAVPQLNLEQPPLLSAPPLESRSSSLSSNGNGKHVHWASSAQSIAFSSATSTQPVNISKSAAHKGAHSSFAPSSLSSSFAPGIGSQPVVGSFIPPPSLSTSTSGRGYSDLDVAMTMDESMPGAFPPFSGFNNTHSASSQHHHKTPSTSTAAAAGNVSSLSATKPSPPSKAPAVTNEGKDKPKASAPAPAPVSKPQPAPAPAEPPVPVEKPAQKGKVGKANGRKGNMRNKSAV